MFSRHSCKVLLFVLLILSACGNRDNDSSNDDTAAIRKVDEYLATRNDSARTAIETGIRTAKDSMTRYEFEARLARYYYTSPTPDSLLPIVARVESFAKNKTNEERGRLLLAHAYNTQAVYYHAFHLNQAEQKELYRKSYDLIMLSDDKTEAHKVAANLGDAYAFNNELPKAAEWYRRALFLVDSLQLPDKENSTLYLGLAGIYQQLGDNEMALKYYKSTEKIYKSMSVSMQAYFLNNFGSFYYYLPDYNKSLGKFLALQQLLTDNGMQNNFDMYLCRINLADVYLNLDSLSKARKCLEFVEPFANRNGDPAILYYCHTIRIGIAVKEKDYANVRKMIQRYSDGVGIPFQLQQIRAKYLRDFYTATGNYKQALEDLLAQEAYNDSIEYNRAYMRTADVMSQFSSDTLRLHHDIKMQQQHAISQRNKLVAIIALSLVIVLILILMLWIQRSHKRMAEARAKVLDLRLQSARIRISPHFIFNVLNNHVITSERKEDDDDIIQLSKLIRQNLNMSRELIVPLSDELKFVRQYVNVEQPLVGDDFDFQINITDGINAGKIRVPSMMIQILVENAFVHALSGWQGHKMLHVDITLEGNNVKIAVSDNGKGFNPVSLKGKNHTGLNIIRQTIAVLNSRSRHKKIIFKIENLKENGKTIGCQSTLLIPKTI